MPNREEGNDVVIDVVPRWKCSIGGAHYWVLPLPDGPLCEGKCNKCGEVRTFANSNDGYITNVDHQEITKSSKPIGWQDWPQ